ncbi:MULTISPECIES: hypothetical protein [unclassified Microcoleus]|uniref:hypothetical protein n=1 Tax=unclassified Microcoleus TaxID=2642155 RepID=UPI002FD11067
MVKKDRQQNYYTIAYPKKYVTNRVPINHLLVNNLLPDRTFLSNSIALKPSENLSAL